MSWRPIIMETFHGTAEQSTSELLQAAIAAYAEVHSCYPDKIVLHPLRRISLPADQWDMYNSPLPIPLFSPDETLPIDDVTCLP